MLREKKITFKMHDVPSRKYITLGGQRLIISGLQRGEELRGARPARRVFDSQGRLAAKCI